MADGHGGNYTSRVNGLAKYVETYLAVAKAIKRVVPTAAFGPSNMAGISGDVDAGAGEHDGGKQARAKSRARATLHEWC